MQKGIILGCGNRSNAGMDTVTCVDQERRNMTDIQTKCCKMMKLGDLSLGQLWVDSFRVLFNSKERSNVFFFIFFM
jgi:hypothetical protein